MSGTPSPTSSGVLTDPDGGDWTIRRKHLDLRRVRSRLRRADVPVLLCSSAGAELRWIPAAERDELWEEIRRCYTTPGAERGPCDFEYTGHEFTNADGNRLLLIEVWC